MAERLRRRTANAFPIGSEGSSPSGVESFCVLFCFNCVFLSFFVFVRLFFFFFFSKQFTIDEFFFSLNKMQVPEFVQECVGRLGLKEAVGECGVVFTGACARQLVSKGLGYGVVAGSSLVKVPQIAKIVRSGTAAGVSRAAVVLDLLGYVLTVAYCHASAFPFSTYGESFFLMLTGAVLAALACRVPWALAAAGLGAVLAAMRARVLPLAVLAWGQAATLPLFVVAKVPQIALCARTRSAGQLSLATFALNTLGAAARVFTTLQELADPLMLAASTLSVLLNGTIALQIIYYSRNSKKQSPPEVETKKEK